MHTGEMLEAFPLESGTKKGCLLSLHLFEVYWKSKPAQ